jgi:hypothetical protein
MPMREDSTVAFPFAFESPLDTWARWFAVVPTRCYVRADPHGFEAVYGLHRLSTVWSNVASVEPTGPYRAWRIFGPARLSLADRGLTMAASTAGGACIRFHRPVRGFDPLGVIRHPGVTLAVDDIDGFLGFVERHIGGDLVADRDVLPPDHREGSIGAAVRAIWRWRSRDVRHEQVNINHIDLPAVDRAGDADDQPVEVAVGPTFHRCYRTVVRGASLGAEQAMAAIQADPNVLADLNLAPFTKVRGTSGAMAVGDRYVIEVAGPWKGAVEVVEVTPTSLRLATLEGHMESGLIEMRAADRNAPGDVSFTIESWARSHDRFLDVMYDKLGIAKALQGEMWATACDRFADLVAGRSDSPLDVRTERAS